MSFPSIIRSYLIKFRTKGFAGLWRLIQMKILNIRHRNFYPANYRSHLSTIPARGITFIGNLGGKDSISKVSRDFIFSLNEAGIPFQAFDPGFAGDPSDSGIERLLTPSSRFDLRKYEVVVEMFGETVPRRLCERHVRIPFWEFESGFLEIYPSARNASEVAGMSDFNVEYYRRILPQTVRVHKILYPFRILDVQQGSINSIREKYKLGKDEFVVFFNFSYLSGFNRKNPVGVIKAFARAFSNKPDAKARLVFKTMHSKDFSQAAERLRSLAKELGVAENVVFIDNYIPQSEIYGLTAACDTYISLHRGEGFGLGVAEAMSLGKPVVVTDYSSTTEFCNSENSIPVSYSMIPVPPSQIDHSFYNFVEKWADADIDAAAAALRRLHDSPALRQELGAKARKSIIEHFSIKNFRKSVIIARSISIIITSALSPGTHRKQRSIAFSDLDTDALGVGPHVLALIVGDRLHGKFVFQCNHIRQRLIQGKLRFPAQFTNWRCIQFH